MTSGFSGPVRARAHFWAQARTRDKNASLQNGLLRAPHGIELDTRAKSTAGGADPACCAGCIPLFTCCGPLLMLACFTKATGRGFLISASASRVARHCACAFSASVRFT